MKRVLEGILAVLIAVLSCIVFINVILRYGFESSILSVDELSRYLFVWLTFIGAIVALWITLTFRSLCGGKTFASESASTLAADTFADFIVMPRIRLGQPAKALQDWSDHSPILGLPIGLMYIACLPTSVAIALIELRRLYHLITRNDSFQQPQQGA